MTTGTPDQPRGTTQELMKEMPAAKKHWLVRPETIRLLWIIGVLTLIGVTLLDLTLSHPHAYFGIDGRFAFYSAYGFLTCAAMVIGSKLLGYVLKRPETYYVDAAKKAE